jgi:signal recognition particle subunit SEC65
VAASALAATAGDATIEFKLEQKDKLNPRNKRQASLIVLVTFNDP